MQLSKITFKNILILACGLFVALTLSAAEVEMLKMREKDRLLLLARPSDKISVNSVLKLNLKTVKCQGAVKKLNDKQMLLELESNCKLWSEFKVGNKINIEMSSKVPFVEGWVESFDFNDHQIKVLVPLNQEVIEGSVFNLYAFDARYCTVVAEKIIANAFLAKTNDCTFEFEIREGMRVELQKKITEQRKYKNTMVDRYYLSMGFFYPKITYGGVAEKRFTDNLNEDSTVSNVTFSFELLGLYFPIKNNRYWWGGSIRTAYDGYSGENIAFEFYHLMLSASVLAFYNHQQKLSGPYLRADLGIARQMATQVNDSTTGQAALPSEKTGWGMLLGGGWAVAWNKNYLMPWLGYSYRSTSNSDVSMIELGLNFLY